MTLKTQSILTRTTWQGMAPYYSITTYRGTPAMRWTNGNEREIYCCLSAYTQHLSQCHVWAIQHFNRRRLGLSMTLARRGRCVDNNHSGHMQRAIIYI